VFIGYEEAKNVWRTARLWEIIKDIVDAATSFVSRQANFVAHTLTKVSRLHVRHQEFDLVPFCMETF
jgi:hypothetical protein